MTLVRNLSLLLVLVHYHHHLRTTFELKLYQLQLPLAFTVDSIGAKVACCPTPTNWNQHLHEEGQGVDYTLQLVKSAVRSGDLGMCLCYSILPVSKPQKLKPDWFSKQPACSLVLPQCLHCLCIILAMSYVSCTTVTVWSLPY